MTLTLSRREPPTYEPRPASSEPYWWATGSRAQRHKHNEHRITFLKSQAVYRERKVAPGTAWAMDDATTCGVCHGALKDVLPPDPMATEVGHEPPLARARDEGTATGVRRREHAICNRRKGNMTDDELVIALLAVVPKMPPWGQRRKPMPTPRHRSASATPSS